MTPAELLDDLRARGVELHPSGDRLRLRGPTRAITPQLVESVRAVRAELLRLLARDRCGTLDQSLAIDEILGFPAALLSQLPLPTILDLELASGRRCRAATHPACCPPFERGCEWWLGLGGDSGATVAMVLAHLGAVLRAVVIEGGSNDASD